MERDEVILGAFCLFVLLLGIRQRLHRTGTRSNRRRFPFQIGFQNCRIGCVGRFDYLYGACFMEGFSYVWTRQIDRILFTLFDFCIHNLYIRFRSKDIVTTKK